MSAERADKQQAGAQLRQAPDAASAGQGLHVLAKPIGPVCDIKCDYCYYPDGGYILQVRKVKKDGSLTPADFNPRPINVAKAEWRSKDGGPSG